MTLAIFDLDNTLLAADSDYLWGRFLVEQGIVDAIAYEQENQRFYEAYRDGTLDIHAYLEFALAPLAAHPSTVLNAWRECFVREWIEPHILPKAVDLLSFHRQRDDILLIITATNSFITQPIAALLEVPHLLATEVERVDGRYTGRSAGIPCFQQGKVERLMAWLEQMGHTLEDSWFYSDSHNDLPLLKQVTHPVAVDPDPVLAAYAQTHHWSIISLRD